MSLTAKDVSEIMRVLEDSSFDELSLEMDGVKLTLRRGEAPADQVAHTAPAPAAKVGAAQAAPPRAAKAASTAKAPTDPDAIDVPSPLLGVFYRAPRPGEPPFVDVGSKVEADTIIGIIEVMKLMNTVRAGVQGEVAEILAQNGALVEYDQVLLRVRKAG